MLTIDAVPYICDSCVKLLWGVCAQSPANYSLGGTYVDGTPPLVMRTAVLSTFRTVVDIDFTHELGGRRSGGNLFANQLKIRDGLYPISQRALVSGGAV